MDILVFALFLGMALTFIGLDFYKKAPYLSVLGGITLIFLGVFMSVDGGLSQAFCDDLGSNSTITCLSYTLPSFSFASNFSIALGAMLMMVGVGVVADTFVRFKSGGEQ